MAKRAASTTSSPTEPSPSGLNEHLSESARRQLGALRRALETRLAALEQVLTDPSRGESLAGLILDLSRVATEEAQAAASQACFETKVQADKDLAAFRTSAKAALDAAQAAQRLAEATLEQERGELRRAVEQAQLEIHKQSDLLTARGQLEVDLRADRERLEAQVVKQQSIGADLQRTVAEAKQQLETERRSKADWQSQLEAERASGSKLRQFAESAAARLTTLERELSDERSAHEAALADLADARTAHEAAFAGLADARTAHEAAFADLADARTAHEAALADLADARAAHEAVVAELARERKAASDRDGAYAQLQSQFETERATVAHLQQAAARAEELSATLGRETSRVQVAGQEAAVLQNMLAESRKALAAAQEELDTERASMADVRHAAETTDQQLASARSNEAQAVADYQKVAAQLDAMIKEREAVADELTAARKWINDLREAEAEFALPAAPAAPPHVEASPAKAKALAPAPSAPPKPPKTLTAAGGAGGEEGWQAIRLASRHVFSTEVFIQVNGDPARLYDLSISGCQLLSPTALKPNQMVKILLPDRKPLTCAGKVVWTRLEPMGMGEPLGYRAGVRFTKADEAAIESFAARHTTPA